MADIDIFTKLNQIGQTSTILAAYDEDSERARQIANHKLWLQSIRKERPNTGTCFRVGVYIRYFNQTKYENYLEFHKKQFEDTLALCPRWTLVDFYIDEGASPPNMETAKELSRLVDDCVDGKIDLVLTQKVSNMSKKPMEITFLSRMLASLEKPVGIYFISEDIYTLASYYQGDLHDDGFLPSADWKLLPEDNGEQ